MEGLWGPQKWPIWAAHRSDLNIGSAPPPLCTWCRAGGYILIPPPPPPPPPPEKKKKNGQIYHFIQILLGPILNWHIMGYQGFAVCQQLWFACLFMLALGVLKEYNSMLTTFCDSDLISSVLPYIFVHVYCTIVTVTLSCTIANQLYDSRVCY